MSDYTKQNRRAWNEIARVREKTFPPAEFFAGGGLFLDQRAIDAARALFPELRSLRLIHLQCATGEETLSWAVLGAEATGVDLSDEQIELARAKAAAAGLSITYVAADVYDLPAALPEGQQGGYDLVYTGGGALVWLPYITAWAKVVFALLRPGGRLLLHEIHPISGCLWAENGQLIIDSDYFGCGRPDVVRGWTHFKGGEDAKEDKYEFSWPIGDVVTALAQTGLIIERLEEFPGGPEWRFGPLQPLTTRLPGDYILIARRP